MQPATGSKRHNETDYAGAGAHPLTLNRSYRSDTIAVSGFINVEVRWMHSYQARLIFNTYGDLNPTTAIRPDATLRRFFSSSTGTPRLWQGDLGTRDSLVELRDAAGALIGWQYTVFDTDAVETYDTAGKLLSIRQRNGWITTLTYSDATTPTAVAPSAGLLIGVKNHFGRELKFIYNAQGRMAEALPPGAVAGSGAGAATSPIRYGYDEAASLGSGVPAQGQLTSVTWQDGSVRRYHYEDSRHAHALTGITDEAGVRWATYAYDAYRRVVSEVHAGGADRIEFSYGLGQTTVTDYSGAGGAATQRTYTFTNNNGVLLPTSVSAPCSLCGNTQQSTSYNATGEVIKTVAHDGTVTFHAYDAKGRETERASFPASFQSATTRPALANATSVVSTKWHATWNLPTQIAEPGKVSAYSYGTGGRLTGQSWTATTDATGSAKFAAVKTGTTFATGWSYNTSNLATTVVTRETDPGATAATETGRWTLAYGALGDVTRVTDAAVTPNTVGTITSYSNDGRPLAGKLPDGRTFTYGYGAEARLSSMQLSDGYRVNYTYNTKGQLSEARATDGGLLVISYGADGKPIRYTANGEVVFDNMAPVPTLQATGNVNSFMVGAAVVSASNETLPRPIALPDIDWGDIGARGRMLGGACVRTLGVGLSLLLFSSEVGTCSTVDSQQKKECKKDPCEKELPTSNAARREVMRRVGLPVESSVPVAANLAVPGYEQYVYWNAKDGKFIVLSHHPADGDHPCPHWHAGYAKMDPEGSTMLESIRKFQNGAWRYFPLTLVAHKKE